MLLRFKFWELEQNVKELLRKKLIEKKCNSRWKCITSINDKKTLDDVANNLFCFPGFFCFVFFFSFNFSGLVYITITAFLSIPKPSTDGYEI